MVAPQKLRALLFLGYHALVVHPLRVLRRTRAQQGKPRFLANYAPEGLVPTSAPDRKRMPAFMGCIGCGLCDMVCPLVGKLDRRDFRGPSLVALAYTRATPDLGHVATTLRHLPADCGTCNRCVEVCPRQVPLKEIFEYGNRKLDEVLAFAPPTRLLPGRS